MSGYQILSSVSLNWVAWITSLREHEAGVTRRIWDDLEPTFARLNVAHEVVEPLSADELLAYLDELAINAREGLKPVIHFDTHGDKEGGISIAATSEQVPWSVIGEKLRAINEGCNNNLCVVSLACYGFHQIEAIDITRPSPFYAIAAAEHEILAGEIEAAVPKFYEDLFSSRDLMGAFERHFGDCLRTLHCEQVLFTVLARYLTQHGFGKGARKRVEHFVTLMNTSAKGAADLKTTRAMAREFNNSTPALLDRYRNQFLMGRPTSFDIDDIVQFVRNAKANKESKRTGTPRRP